jgi:hypothetical protein
VLRSRVSLLRAGEALLQAAGEGRLLQAGCGMLQGHEPVLRQESGGGGSAGVRGDGPAQSAVLCQQGLADAALLHEGL